MEFALLPGEVLVLGGDPKIEGDSRVLRSTFAGGVSFVYRSRLGLEVRSASRIRRPIFIGLLVGAVGLGLFLAGSWAVNDAHLRWKASASPCGGNGPGGGPCLAEPTVWETPESALGFIAVLAGIICMAIGPIAGVTLTLVRRRAIRAR